MSETSMKKVKKTEGNSKLEKKVAISKSPIHGYQKYKKIPS